MAIAATGADNWGSGEEEFRRYVRDQLEIKLKPSSNLEKPFFGAGDIDEDVEKGRRVLETLAQGGWLTPTWPKEYGGPGLSAVQAVIVAEELAAFETPGLYAFSVALNMVATVLLKYGTEGQKTRWLSDIQRGRSIWCQLFSEPNAGSDLASLSSKAIRDGDGWIVNGQKVWSSRAHYADWGLLLARTNSTGRKHDGITAFAVDMHLPGITVRPLRQMNGDAHFNEVFLDNVRLGEDMVLGDVGHGWSVAMTTLGTERAATGGAAPPFGGVGGVLALMQHRGVRDDRVLRQRAAKLMCDMEVYRWTSMRARAVRLAGSTPGPEGSGQKLRLARIAKDYANLAADIKGLDAVIDGSTEALLLVTVPSLSIRGGTDEIQRNIVAERVLGLPRDPR